MNTLVGREIIDRSTTFRVPTMRWLQLFALLGFLACNSVVARAQDTSGRGPVDVIRAVIARTGEHGFPSWANKSFGSAMRPWLTGPFIAIVEHGAAVALQRHIDLFDAEFFTGSQSVVRAKLLKAVVTGQTAEAASVKVVVATTDLDQEPKGPGAPYTYRLRRIGGSWLIDDILDGDRPGALSRKQLFSDPAKYGS